MYWPNKVLSKKSEQVVGKLAPQFIIGPFTVSAVLTPVIVELQTPERVSVGKSHTKNLKFIRRADKVTTGIEAESLLYSGFLFILTLLLTGICLADLNNSKLLILNLLLTQHHESQRLEYPSGIRHWRIVEDSPRKPSLRHGCCGVSADGECYPRCVLTEEWWAMQPEYVPTRPKSNYHTAGNAMSSTKRNDALETTASFNRSCVSGAWFAVVSVQTKTANAPYANDPFSNNWVSLYSMEFIETNVTTAHLREKLELEDSGCARFYQHARISRGELGPTLLNIYFLVTFFIIIKFPLYHLMILNYIL